MIPYFVQFNPTQSSNGWYRFTNPLDYKSRQKKDNTMGVNFEAGYVQCFRTGYRASITRFVADCEGITYHEAKELVGEFKYVRKCTPPSEVRAAKFPEFFMPLDMGSGSIGDRARNYLIDRGFDIDTLAAKGFGYCYDGDYICSIIIPYIRDGKLVYWTARSIIGVGDGPKYQYPKKSTFSIGKSELIYNFDCLKKVDDLFVVEGAFDAETIGKNAVAIGGAKPSGFQFGMINNSSAKNVIVVPDRGFRGVCALAYKNIIRNPNKNLFILDPDELGEGKDANDWGRETILNNYSNAQPMDRGTLYKIRKNAN